jgi:hypothetical protein
MSKSAGSHHRAQQSVEQWELLQDLLCSRVEEAHDLDEKMNEASRLLVELVGTLQEVHEQIRHVKEAGAVLLERYCCTFREGDSEGSSAAMARLAESLKNSQ